MGKPFVWYKAADEIIEKVRPAVSTTPDRWSFRWASDRRSQNKLAAEYRRGTRADKTAILDQIVKLTGWHRDHARARLRAAGEIRVAP